MSWNLFHPGPFGRMYSRHWSRAGAEEPSRCSGGSWYLVCSCWEPAVLSICSRSACCAERPPGMGHLLPGPPHLQLLPAKGLLPPLPGEDPLLPAEDLLPPLPHPPPRKRNPLPPGGNPLLSRASRLTPENRSLSQNKGRLRDPRVTTGQSAPQSPLQPPRQPQRQPRRPQPRPHHSPRPLHSRQPRHSPQPRHSLRTRHPLRRI